MKLSPTGPPACPGSRLAAFASLLLLTCVPDLLRAQLPSPSLHELYPLGAAAGSTVEITIKGDFLDEATALVCDGLPIEAKAKRVSADALFPEGRPVPGVFVLAIPDTIAPGTYEWRVRTHWGLSNPRPFVISPKGTKDHRLDSPALTRDEATTLAPGEIVNARVGTNQRHWFKLPAGTESWRIWVDAESLDARLDATIELFDENGLPLAENHDRRNRDPWLSYHFPDKEAVYLSVNDFLFRGGEGYAYRLHLSKAGDKPTLALDSNAPPPLPANRFSPVPPLQRPYVAPGLNAASPQAVSTWKPRDPLVAEEEKESDPPQAVTLPVVVSGRFDRDTDADRYRFQAKKGVRYAVTVHCDRLGVGADPFLFVEKVNRNEAKEESLAKVAENDDRSHQAAGSAVVTRTRDAELTFTADADALYQVTVINQFAQGGPDLVYALGLREARPGFSLIASCERPFAESRKHFPTAPQLRRNGSFPIPVSLIREDGFDGTVTLRAKELPSGVEAGEATIPPGSNSAVLVLSATGDAPAWEGAIRVEGVAKVGDREVIEPALIAAPVTVIQDTNKERLRSRTWSRLPLSVLAHEPAPLRLEVAEAELSVIVGETLEIPLKGVEKQKLKGDLTVSVWGLPHLKKSPQAKLKEKESDTTLKLSFKASNDFKPQPGTYSLVLRGTGTMPYQIHPEGAERAQAEQKRLEAKHQELTAAAQEATKARDQAKQALDQARKNAAAASEQDKPKLEAAAKEGESALAKAEETLEQANALAKRADQAKKEAAERAKKLTERAKEKDRSFAVYSQPIALKVIAPPQPEKK